MKKLISFILIALFFISCEKDCYTSPEPIIFEFVNSNGENLIENGTLSSAFSISEKLDNGNTVGVQLTKTADNKVILERVGSFNGTKNYTFYSNIRFFDFSIRSSNITDGCDGFKIDEVKFENINATKETGFYKIVLE